MAVLPHRARRRHRTRLAFGLCVLCDPHRGEPLLRDQQVDELAADEVLDLAADERNVYLDRGMEFQSGAGAGSAGESTALPVSVAGAPGIVTLMVAVACPSLIGDHASSRTRLRSPRWNCCTTPGKPVGAQPSASSRCRRRLLVEGQSIQRVGVHTGIGQPSQPVVLVAECAVDLFDAALVVGGHVE